VENAGRGGGVYGVFLRPRSGHWGAFWRCPVEGLNLPHFNEEAIEMAAMGRLHNVRLQKHLSRCLKCTARVVEHRAWIAALRCALSTRLHPSDVLAVKKSGFL
jgi:hypothetical protein